MDDVEDGDKAHASANPRGGGVNADSRRRTWWGGGGGYLFVYVCVSACV